MRSAILLTAIAAFCFGCTHDQPAASAPAPATKPVTGPPAADPAAPPSDVKSLMAREEQLNDKCRGGSGDDPATMKACDERDAVMKTIESRGWCWGHESQIQADKTWERCAPKAK